MTRGVKGEPQMGRIPLKEFRERGIYHVPRDPGDNLAYTALEDFRRDPDGCHRAVAAAKDWAKHYHHTAPARATERQGYRQGDRLAG